MSWTCCAMVYMPSSCFWLIYFIFLRKISPELTSAVNPSLFAEEDQPWANIHASMPIFLHFICGKHTTAWLAKRCPVHTRVPNWWTTGCREVERVNLTTVPLGRPLSHTFLTFLFLDVRNLFFAVDPFISQPLGYFISFPYASWRMVTVDSNNLFPLGFASIQKLICQDRWSNVVAQCV